MKNLFYLLLMVVGVIAVGVLAAWVFMHFFGEQYILNSIHEFFAPFQRPREFESAIFVLLERI